MTLYFPILYPPPPLRTFGDESMDDKCTPPMIINKITIFCTLKLLFNKCLKFLKFVKIFLTTIIIWGLWLNNDWFVESNSV